MAGAGKRVYASDVNTRVGTASLTGDSTTYGATESGSLLSVTASVVAGRTYRISLFGCVSADVANDISLVRVKEDSATGTQLHGPRIYIPDTSTVGYQVAIAVDWTAPSSAAKQFHVTGQRVSGTGTAHRLRAATSRPVTLTVDLINP